MTQIVHDVATKKALRERIAAINSGDFSLDVAISDPSPFLNPNQRAGYGAIEMLQGAPGVPHSCIVTNHPKRSWFATIKVVDGRLVVK